MVLVEGVLDGHDGVLGAHVLVELHHVRLGLDERGVRVVELEAQVVGLVVGVPELGGGDVHGQLDLAGVARILDGIHERLQALVVVLDVGCEAALVTNGRGVLAVPRLYDVFQRVVHLGTDLQGLLEGLGASGGDHELLHGQLVARVLSAVDDVHHRHGHLVLLGPGPLHVDLEHIEVGVLELAHVLVELEAEGLGAGAGDAHGHGQHGVGAQHRLREAPLVLGAVQVVNHVVVQLLLEADIPAHQLGRDDPVDVADGLEHALALEPRAAVSELQSLVDACGGARGHNGREGAVAGRQLDLDGRVSPAVHHLAAEDARDLGLLVRGQHGLLLLLLAQE
mmetsp:Transcript_36428/g.104772  ORF Transcript_36428/g.104772 Transcript_36428/m.104772 type:complete len:338 (-) Transcript_36428:138-1151(-)